MSKVAKCLFMDGLDPRNWSRFTKITAQRAFSIANYYHHDFGVRLGRVYNLAAETRCPESVYVGDLYQGARWMETELWTFKPISLDPPEFRRRLDTVSRPLAERNMTRVLSAVFAELAARRALKSEGLENVDPWHWFGAAMELAAERAWEGAELEDQDWRELIPDAADRPKGVNLDEGEVRADT